MDTATCTEDAHTYTAVEFSRLAPSDLERKRRQLICEGCGNPAFFRKGSTSGRGPCFGARPHDDDCELAATDNEIRLPGVGDDQDELFNPGDRIIVDLAYGPQNTDVHLDQERGLRRARGGQFVGEGGGPRVAQMHRRLSSLLRMLVTAPNFRYSDQLIAVANQPEIPARDFFVNFSDVTSQYAGQFKGFWGQLTDARPGADDSLWLNSGGKSDVSFCLPAEHLRAVMDRFDLEEAEDFSGAYMLVFGTLRISRNNKMICVIENPAMVTLR
jgi:hypothetical protein